jgi:tRNA modification GTPase
MTMRPYSESHLDTIAALATPVGRSALALVRVSGPRTRELMRAVVPDLPEPLPARRAQLLAVHGAHGDLLDRALVTFFQAPASYTGEDMAEISLHGSPVLARALIAALVSAGARPARPGEFTERAFLLGKMDLIEAEAVRELIEARTERAARFSTRRLEGGLSRRLAGIREDLLRAAAELAATIDFSEDVGDRVPDSVTSRLASAREALAQIAATYETGRLLESGCRVAILGSPNAGKSTLFNAVLGTPRAIVTEVPGTTRDTLDATVDVGGIPVAVVDTAGLREPEDPVERIGVARALEEAQRADAVIYVYDVTRGWREDDEAALAALNGKPIAVIANKSDLAEGQPLLRQRDSLMSGIAADAGERLHACIAGMIRPEISTEAASDVLSSLRQKELVARARDAARSALSALEEGVSPEYAVTHVHEGLDALADLCGETTSEDVLHRIFADFCIGK